MGLFTKKVSVDFTKGDIVAGLVKFSVPLMIGNLLQQFYNIADTLIVGKFLGAEAMAAIRHSLFRRWMMILYPRRAPMRPISPAKRLRRSRRSLWET